MSGKPVVHALLLAIATTGCGLLAGQETPDECGFPEGTALEFAGRSTTSALGVQEVVDDPLLSVEPADIYITRDEFTQGDLQGRLVYAIYVTQSGFVEVTVHPDDLPPVADEPEPPPAPPRSIGCATCRPNAGSGWPSSSPATRGRTYSSTTRTGTSSASGTTS